MTTEPTPDIPAEAVRVATEAIDRLTYGPTSTRMARDALAAAYPVLRAQIEAELRAQWEGEQTADFYVEDEPMEEVLAAFERGPVGYTAPPPAEYASADGRFRMAFTGAWVGVDAEFIDFAGVKMFRVSASSAGRSAQTGEPE